MKNINDFIVMVAIFDKQLAEAIQEKDLNKVSCIMKTQYDDDLSFKRLEDKVIDIEKVYVKYQEALKEDLSWAM